VFALLLHGLTSSEAWQEPMMRVEHERRVITALKGSDQLRPGGQIRSLGDAAAEPEAKMLPVRFPANTHEQLKAWCEEHNFPMAAVVRGLVERFLESQQTP
jgi:hypothetical protein